MKNFWVITKNVTLIVLTVLMIWMLLGKPWPSIDFKTDRDRFAEAIATQPVPEVAPVATTPNPRQPENTSVAVLNKITNSVDFDEYGEYTIVFDSNREMDTLGWWNGNLVRAGSKNLADLKRDGGTISFTMPLDGWINNSAGELFVDNVEWDLGNYGEDPQQETMIYADQVITVSYQADNDSAGFQLWFLNQ
ncbi:hypothetical protein K8R14_03395 [bacterium]|nr:hypothetical protein [bacterium]